MRLVWFPSLVLVAIVGVRVIGVRMGWWRAILIAWLGLATSGILLRALSGDRGDGPSTVLVIAVGLLMMIAWTGLFELFSSLRSDTALRSERNPLHAVRDKVARLGRKLEIALIATRFGLGRYARPHAKEPRGSATGRALRGSLERAGGVYVKLGQFLSTRPDLVSAEIASELRLLQQHVEPLPIAAVHRVLDEELGAARDSLVSFSDQPAAAASIAQVHQAVLENGQRVAVKVQRPGVARRVLRDLDILVRTADRLERRTQWAYELRLLETVQSFAESVTGELDFEAEARNLRLITNAVRNHPRFVVPQPIAQLTRTRVLVMEWVDGVPLTQAAAALDSTQRADLARAVLRCLLDQILVVGTFHADPHPGNLYLTNDDRVALIDCGAIGLLDQRQRSALQAVLLAIATQDATELRDALWPMTTASRTIDESMLERALGVLLAHHLGQGATPGGAFITALMELMRQFGLALEPVVGGALRALATLQSTLEVLAPGFDLLDEAKSYGQTLVNPFWSQAHPKSPREELEALLPIVLPTLARLPRRLDRIIDSVGRNDIAVGVHLFPSDQDRRFINQLTAQLVGAIVPTAVGLIGGVLLLASNDQLSTDTGRILQAVGLGCVGIALLVLLSSLVKALRSQRERL